jgi:hypothetical protein
MLRIAWDPQSGSAGATTILTPGGAIKQPNSKRQAEAEPDLRRQSRDRSLRRLLTSTGKTSPDQGFGNLPEQAPQ